MTVKDLFTSELIEIEFIEAKFEGGYWENCFNFVNDYWHRSVDSLSIKQRTWLSKILDDCVEKRIEG